MRTRGIGAALAALAVTLTSAPAVGETLEEREAGGTEDKVLGIAARARGPADQAQVRREQGDDVAEDRHCPAADADGQAGAGGHRECPPRARRDAAATADRRSEEALPRRR